MSSYYERIAKAIICNAGNIIDAIDRYIAKADEDLENQLADEGYAEAKRTVEAINDVEEQVADVLHEQTDNLLAVIGESDSIEDLKERVEELLESDTIEEDIADISNEMLEDNVVAYANAYMQESDGDLVVSEVRDRTSDWFNQWSQQLGGLMRISTHKQISDLIEETIKNGDDIATLTRKIIDGGWRNEYYQAKRVAVTEVLRAHSVAREEAIQQSPAVDKKEWRHTGGHKNRPRPNHVAMDHQIVPKEEPFVLQGRDGATYYPMYPRDPVLPAGETVNCHCIHRGVVNDEVLGLPLKERQKMHQDYIDADNGAYAKSKDNENSKKAGIKPYNALESFEKKSREKQIKYIGGKEKMGLYDAGLVPDEDTLKKIKKMSLKELHADGIFTVNKAVLDHSYVGDFIDPSKKYPNGRLDKGGHSAHAMGILDEKGIEYVVNKTYSNGVKIGYVVNHTSKFKNGNTSVKPNADIGQSWFPEDWDRDDIRAAGTYVANTVKGDSLIKFSNFRGVKVGIFTDSSGAPTTIFPDNMEQPFGDLMEGARDD